MTKSIAPVDYEIGVGDEAIYRTVDYMWHYALRDANTPEIKALVRKLKGKSKLETIKNIYDFVWQNVKYELDPPDRELLIFYCKCNLTAYIVNTYNIEKK